MTPIVVFQTPFLESKQEATQPTETILLLKKVKYEFRRRREIGELKKELERQKREADEVKKALEDKITQEMVLKGELDADEVSVEFW